MYGKLSNSEKYVKGHQKREKKKEHGIASVKVKCKQDTIKYTEVTAIVKCKQVTIRYTEVKAIIKSDVCNMYT